MNLKRSPFAIQDKNARDLDNAKDYPTIADLMRQQKVTNDDANTVHHRRDLDSLGWFLNASIVMNFKKLLLSILNKGGREMDFIKGVYKSRVQAEIESYKDSKDEYKIETIQAQDVFMLDRFSIYWKFIDLQNNILLKIK